MAFMRPNAADPPKPTNPNMNRGKTRNPPTYLEFGGFSGPNKGMQKSKNLKVEKPMAGSGFSGSRK